MKAATGELSLTLITVIAIGAVFAIFMIFKDDIKNKITSGWDDIKAPTAYVEVIHTDLV